MPFLVLTLINLTHSYICSRIYLHDPPGQDDDSMPHPEIPLEALRKEQELADAEPDVNPWACTILLVITVGLMGVTAEFVRLPISLLTRTSHHPRRLGSIVILISPLSAARRQHTVRPKRSQSPRRVRSLSSHVFASVLILNLFPAYHRWFGIVLLPIVSFSADGAVAIVFFIRSSLRQFFTAPKPPDLLAEARAIDMSIQFLLFWMPLVTLLGWWMNKPMSMFFGKKKNMPPHPVQKG